MSVKSRLFVCGAVTVLCLEVTGCGEAMGVGPEPAYEGCATDENWATLDDYITSARVQTGSASAPAFTGLQNGMSLPSSAAPTFKFQPSATLAGTPNGDATCPQFQPARRAGLGVAHLAAVSGQVYDLHFDVGGAQAYRVLTTRQSASVPLATWQSWKGKSVTLTLYTARLLNNDVKEGPFQAPALSVTVTP